MNSPFIRSSTKYVMLLVLLFIFYTFLNAQQTVTIQECYRLAEENYPQIRQYDLIRKSEQYDLSNASKSWLPQLALNAKATYQSDVTKLPIDFSQLPVEIAIPTLSKDQYQVVAELNQTIWDGGASSSVKQLTKTAAETERKQLESDLYSLRERVNQLYFGCLLQADLLLQNRLLQKDLRINLVRVQALIANGMANESDKELLEVELLNVSQRETEIEASRVAYLRMLSYFIGQNEPGKIQLEKLVAPAVDFSWPVRRPELSVFEAKSTYADSQLKAIKAGLMPRFGAFVQAGYGRPGLNMLADAFSSFYVAGVRMSWNLGGLYTQKNDRRKVETVRRQIDVRRETFLFNTRMQLIQQQEEVKKIVRIMQSDDEIIRLRTNIKKAAEMKLTNGVIAVSDLIREMNAEDMACQVAMIHRTQHLMAIYQIMYITNNE